ncbi:MAG: PilT/PilU family type 4a pilus ATPase [Chlamydiota bacterium]|nr:PilT/PilU family type 4a pilus ATPase [Chlamydiota bacterium]
MENKDSSINQEISFLKLFLQVKHNDASDLHLQVGSPPILRIHGTPQRLDSPPIQQSDMIRYSKEILPEEKCQVLLNKGEMDYSYSVPGEGRMRINFFMQRGSLGLAARMVKTEIPSFKELHLPDVLSTIAELEHGMIIVAGVTGTGKSTTLASVIEYINQRRACHVLTIEDPIEYHYQNKKAFINQREIGVDTNSFTDAIKYAMRQDPDVLLIGEMRDPETVYIALAAAETGHLVLTTVHSGNTATTIGRIIDMFPPEHHFQIRQALQLNLRAIICQKLLPGKKKELPRVPAVEVMINNQTTRELIRKKEDSKLTTAIKNGLDQGMQDFNYSLLQLIKEGLIETDTGIRVSPNPDALKMNLQGIFLDDEKAIY